MDAMVFGSAQRALDCVRKLNQNKVHILGADMGTTDFTGEINYKPGHFKYAMEGLKQWFYFLRERGIKVECLSVSPLEEYCE